MRKTFMILAVIILVLILSILAFYLYITDFGRNDILFAGPRKPKIEIPVTYTIDWWSNQDVLSIDSFDVQIVESNLNLFNNKSLVSYKIAGSLKNGHWLYKIKEIHISERLNSDTTLHCDRIIELTPIVEYTENIEENTEAEEPFVLKNEHTIISNRWGLNRIKFICGQNEKIIELRQTK